MMYNEKKYYFFKFNFLLIKKYINVLLLHLNKLYIESIKIKNSNVNLLVQFINHLQCKGFIDFQLKN